MFIEILGTNFINKGSELMLRSIIAKLKEQIPEAELVFAPSLNKAPFIKRAQLGFYQKIWLQYYNTQWGYLGFVIPKSCVNYLVWCLTLKLTWCWMHLDLHIATNGGLKLALQWQNLSKNGRNRGQK